MGSYLKKYPVVITLTAVCFLFAAITGWVSTCLHLSGIISGLAVCLLPLPVKSGR